MLTPGTIIARHYRVTALVGRGGGGTVYRCDHTELGRPVAIKILHAGHLDTKDARDRFNREARILSTVEHPNVAKFFNAGTLDDDTPFIVMEFVEGKSIQSILDEDGCPGWRRAAEFTVQMCKAVQEIHRRGIVHRDIKPANFMLDETGTVKLVDFGLAKSSSQATLTETGLMLGSLHYMSPEVCRGQRAEASSDIYSLGCVLYTMVYGNPPFQADNPVALLHLHLDGQPPFFENSIELPSLLVEIMRKCLAKSAELRYRTAEELRCALEELLATPEIALGYSGRRMATGPFGLQQLLVAFTCVALVAAWYSTAQWIFQPTQILQDSAPKSGIVTAARRRYLDKMFETIKDVPSLDRMHQDRFISDDEKRELLNKFVSRAAVTSKATSGFAWYLLALHLNGAQYENARENAESLLRSFVAENRPLNADSLLAWQLLAQLLCSATLYDEAQVLLKTILSSTSAAEVSERRIWSLHQLSRIHDDAGSQAERERLLLELLRYWQTRRNGVVALRTTAITPDEPLDKQLVARSGLPVAMGPTTGEALNVSLLQIQLADCYYKQGRESEAHKCLDNVMEYASLITRNDHALLSSLALFCSQTNYPLAIKLYKLGGQDAKSLRDIHCQLAFCFLAQQRYTEALSILLDRKLAFGKDEDSYFTQLLLTAAAKRALGQPTQAEIRELKAYSAQRPGDSSALQVSAGLASWAGKDGDRTDELVHIKELSTGLKQQYLPLPVTVRMVERIIDAGCHQEAIDCCRQIKEKCRRGSLSYYNAELASIRALALSGRADQAVACLNRLQAELEPKLEAMPLLQAEFLQVRASCLTVDQRQAQADLEEADRIFLKNNLRIDRRRLALLHELERRAGKGQAQRYAQERAHVDSMLKRLPVSAMYLLF